MSKLTHVAVGVLVASWCLAGQAGVIGVDTNVSGVQTSTSFSSVDDAVNSLTSAQLTSINPAYTGVEAAQVDINYIGLPITTTYPTPGSPLLTLNIPSLGISKDFVGATRDESQNLLKEYFKQNGDNILGRIGKELAKVSPVYPIAGNPNSLMTQLVMQDFNSGFMGFAGNNKPGEGASSNLIGIGLGYGSFRQDGITSNSYTLPLSYTFRNDLDPRRQISLRLPITMTDADGSKSYYVGLGGSYRFPVSDNWALMPAVNYALAGSADLGTYAGIASASLTSSYFISFETSDLAIGNMVGYYTTTKAKSGDYSYDPGSTNTVTRNGVLFSHPVTVSGSTMSLEYSLIDTLFFGDDLFVNHFDEIGISLGTNKRATSARSYFRSGASYLYSSKSKGFNLTLGYWF
jgi:hypothetical protein